MAPPILCSTHGKTPTLLACDHIAQAVRMKSEVPPFGRVRADLGTLEIPHLICLDCIDRFHLASEVTIPLQGDFDESDFPKTRPVCAKCFEAQQAAHHRAV
jgi:hypothetical protein